MAKRVKMQDRIGEVYGRLTIDAVYREGKRSYAECSCSCGNKLTSRIDALQSGATLSCGCFSKEQTALINKSHGMWKSCTYQSWADMKDRCLNPKHKAYEYYKDVGICEKWLTFEGFYEDLGDRPQGLTLDRIDGTKGYSLDNCRWATGSIQAKNQKKRNIDTSISKYKGVGRDTRAKRTSGYFFSVTKDYTTIRKYCASELQAAAFFNYGTQLLYSDDVALNDIEYQLSDKEKEIVMALVAKKFPEVFNKGEQQ